MFGTTKKKTDMDSKPPMKPTGAERSAVAAARAALENKAKASQEQTTRPSTLRKKPVPQAPSEEAPKASAEMPVPSREEEPASESVETKALPQEPPQNSNLDGPPRNPREAEYDALSRVDTNERAAADREFSKFDQGPLLDQPAFVPEDSPVSETSSQKEEKENEPPTTDEAPEPTTATEPEDSAPAVPSSYDRWAQIRKNAAERAAALDHPRDSEDGGNTSEEESKSIPVLQLVLFCSLMYNSHQALSRVRLVLRPESPN